MNPHTPHRFGPSRWLGYGLLAVALVALTGLPADADDRDLLRTESGQPGVFFLIDTSASMALKLEPGGDEVWAPGWADGAGSRLYQAKQAIYNVFKDADDVDIGLATYNQDQARVIAKHWLYHTTVHPNTVNAVWPLDFPRPDADGLTILLDLPDEDTNGDGVVDDDDVGDGVPETRIQDVDGDVLTFGPAYLDSTGTPITTAGTCAAPLDLDDAFERNRAQAFAISGTNSGGDASVLWVEEGGMTFRLDVWTPGVVGGSPLSVHMEARQVTACPSSLTAPDTVVLSMQLDPHLGESLVVDPPIETSFNDDCGRTECRAGLWDWTDVVSDWQVASKRPFSGQGWEGNYDSGDLSGDATFDMAVTEDDRFCELGLPSCQETVKPVADTSYSPLAHALDSGDMVPIPFTGGSSNVGVLLNRVGPASASANPDFRGAPFYVADGTDMGSALDLAFPDTKPLLAGDRSPLSNALLDFRCWFSGKDSSNKCPDDNPYEDGYFSTACEHDGGLGCRAFYFIVISDGEDNDGQSNAAPSNLSDGGEFDGRMWVINLAGEDGTCKTQPLHPILQNTKSADNCITADNPALLKQTLAQILGEIREEIRAFASAAVPSVQATVQQKIFLTSFTPLNDDSIAPDDSAYWPGRVDSFLKPLPLNDDGTPDRDRACTATIDSGCFLWNADDATETQVNSPNFLGDGADQRRVFYSTETQDGSWTESRRLFEQPEDCSGSGAGSNQAICYDLWRGFGFVGDDVADGGATSSEPGLRSSTDNVITRTLELKEADINPEDGAVTTETYILVDDFHSTPIVVGDPVNTFLFANDVASDGTDCDPDDPDGNPGYRCFFFKHQFRRNALLLGSDDGQLHAFDAGMFRVGEVTDPVSGIELEDEYDNGTGNELWSYIPRPLLPQVNQLATGTSQLYGVDGAPVAADVFIDPLFAAGSTPEPEEREWRTVVVGGFREAGSDLEDRGIVGGRGYYALDITQPDDLTTQSGTENVPNPLSGDFSTGGRVPSCFGDLDTGVQNDSDCGPVPYPAALWEFTDSLPVTPASGRTFLDPLDENRNGIADLGDTWSAPNVGRILVCAGAGSCVVDDASNADPFDPDTGGLRVFNVAIFGGGMDTLAKATPLDPARGNFLYMVDIETGQAIYKRELVGAVPSAPAAVDTDQDGFLDRIYIGTLAGRLYRVDMIPVGGVMPGLTTFEVDTLNCDAATQVCPEVTRIADTSPSTVDADSWDPFEVFDANFDADSGTSVSPPRPLYFRPSVFFIAQRGQEWGLAFGTGDREDLFNFSAQEGRFYVFADTIDGPGDAARPLTEASLQEIGKNAAMVSEQTNFLLDNTINGWFLSLDPDERVITDSFLLSGVTVFSAFEPEIRFEGGTPTTVGCGDGPGGGGGGGGGTNEPPICSKLGTSNIFGVNTTNANGLLSEASGGGGFDLTRSVTVGAFVSNPFAEQSATQTTDDSEDRTADQLDDRLTNIMDTLKGLFPSNCNFANYRIDVKTISADTRLQFIAPVPICIIQKNWKEY